MVNVFVWDAPAHAASWPFSFDFRLEDKAIWLNKKDKAGSCIRYNKAWHKETQIPIEWIADAGHNSNTDKPEYVNELIKEFIAKLLMKKMMK